jgi:hypothetical protein
MHAMNQSHTLSQIGYMLAMTASFGFVSALIAAPLLR